MFNNYNLKYIKKNNNISFSNNNLILYNNLGSILLNLKNVNSLIIFSTFLKYHFKFQFKQLVDICTVDYYLNYNKNNRFEINYMLLSLKYKTRLKIKIYSDEKTIIPSISNLYSSAGWLERENWDMYGIFFSKHKDLRRILTDYGFNGFPFRKDFPLSGYIELRYDDERKTVVYELLEMSQEFRFFEFINPWDWNVPINK